MRIAAAALILHTNIRLVQVCAQRRHPLFNTVQDGFFYATPCLVVFCSQHLRSSSALHVEVYDVVDVACSSLIGYMDERVVWSCGPGGISKGLVEEPKESSLVQWRRDRFRREKEEIARTWSAS